MSDADSIPLISAADLLSPDASVEAELRRGLSDFGLVYLKDHGIHPALLDALYGDFRGFLRRPTEEKSKFGRPEIWFQRGWTPPNTEKAVIAGGQPDFKECWFAMVETPDPDLQLEYPQLFADNLWPEDGTTFRDHYIDCGRALQDLGLTVLRAAARSLALEDETFASMVKGGAHVTRALEYLPLDQDAIDAGILWGEEHTDFNLVTLLPGGRFFDPDDEPAPRPDEQSGLYLRARPTDEAPTGRMVQGTPPPGCVVLQVGQELEILTGGLFLATPHVIKAPRVPGWSRVSLAHFVHVHPHRMLSPLPTFRNEETITRYRPPVLAGTYAMKTMVDIGLAPAETVNSFGYRHYDRLEDLRREET